MNQGILNSGFIPEVICEQLPGGFEDIELLAEELPKVLANEHISMLCCPAEPVWEMATAPCLSPKKNGPFRTCCIATKEAMERLESETLERCFEILQGKKVIIKSLDPRLLKQNHSVVFQ